MTKSQSNGDGDSAAGAAAAAAQDPGSSPAAAEPQKELAAVKDQLLSALAEQQNIRRRAERQAREGARFAAADLIRDLLATADNLRRAIESAPPENANSEALRQWLAGVTSTERGLLETFERHGIRRIVPLGDAFDPNLHEAVFTVPDDERPPGTVVQVVQPGYMLHDRVLRPAMVGVSWAASSEPPREGRKTPSAAGVS